MKLAYFNFITDSAAEPVVVWQSRNKSMPAIIEKDLNENAISYLPTWNL